MYNNLHLKRSISYYIVYYTIKHIKIFNILIFFPKILKKVKIW